jgi:heptosyltransferase III
MPPDTPTIVLARELLALRRRVAPPGSRREALMRKAYVPLIVRLRRRQQAQSLGNAPPVTVKLWEGLRQRVAALPDPPRILVLKLDHLGDFITALPALARLRAAFPASSITLVCGSWNRAWAEQCGLFDDIVVFDLFSVVTAQRGVEASRVAAFQALGLDAFDLAIDLRHDPDSRPLLAHVEAGFRAGFCAPVEMGGDVLDIALPDMEHISLEKGTGRPVHAELRIDVLVAAVISVWSREPHPAATLAKPGLPGLPRSPYAVLAPGAGSPIRVWPIERLAEVGQELVAKHDLDLVLTGAPAQKDDCATMQEMLPRGRTHNLAGAVSLADLPTLIRRSSLYVGYDTGTSHLAASLGVPTVVVMGGIPNPDVWHAEGPRVAVVTGEIACSSCYLVHAADCPFEVRCLTAITPGHVAAACDSILAPVARQSEVLPTT